MTANALDKFDRRLHELGKVFDTQDDGDTVVEAVDFAFQDKCGGAKNKKSKAGADAA